MSQHPVTSSVNKIGRKQELNVIYFLDSNKTRSFKISIGTFRLLIGGFLVLVLWSAGSVWFISNLMSDNNADEVRMTSYLSTIYKYQSQYDKVYELAYPNGKPQVPLPSVATAKPKVAKKIAPVPTGTQQLAAKKLGAPQPIAKTEKPKAVALVNPKIQVETAKFTRADHQLKMKFAIKNMNSPKKASGYLWAVARYVDADNKDHFVGYPHTVQLDAIGRVNQPKRGTRFHMRRFRPVDALFAAPVNVVGEFKDVAVKVLDSTGKEIVRKFPVSLKVGYTKVELAKKETLPVAEDVVNPKGKEPAPAIKNVIDPGPGQ